MVMERWRPSRGITPWRPFRELEELEQGLERFFGWPFLSRTRRLPVEEMEWLPSLDMYEKDDRFVVKAELPGMKEDDIDVSVTDNTLNIKGERKAESEVKEENYYRSERSYGKFYRSVALPSNADAQNIEANYEDGVLEVSIPKAAEAKSRKVKVSAKKK